MNIVKFTYRGRDARCDIHYTKENIILRFGSNEEEKPHLRDVIASLNTKAAERARITGVAIKRVTFSRPDTNTTEVKLECDAASMNGDEMKITLPKFGYRKSLQDTGFGEMKEIVKPIKSDEETMELILDLEESLKDYIVNGAGQMQFSFEEDVRKTG